jgi:hypothetical protein
MTNVATLPLPKPDHGALYLGPARVSGVATRGVTLALPQGATVEARLALGYGYAPQVGDVVLAIGQSQGHYVIGVLDGRGQATLSFPADVELRSETGSVRVTAAKGVELDAPQIELRTDKLTILARDVVERVGSLCQTVGELWSMRAKRSETLVAETSRTQARDVTITTERQVAINGKTIHLG